MRAYEYAEENDMDVEDVKTKFGLKSHMSTVPKELISTDEEPLVPDSCEPVEEVVIANTIEKKPQVTLEEAHSLRGLGGDKDIRFLRFVSQNKDFMPSEYTRVKHLIEKYL